MLFAYCSAGGGGLAIILSIVQGGTIVGNYEQLKIYLAFLKR